MSMDEEINLHNPDRSHTSMAELDDNEVEHKILASMPGKRSIIKGFWRHIKRHKIRAALTMVSSTLLLIAIFPLRYQTLGLVIKRDLTVEVLDSETGKPVNEATVQLRDIYLKTDVNGKASFSKIKPGKVSLKITKKYYDDKSEQITIGLKSTSNFKSKIKANGRQVDIMAVDLVSGEPLSGAIVKSSEISVQTDREGKANIVLSADKPSHSGTVSASGYNDLQIDITTRDGDTGDNVFNLVPSGSLYFLSKKTGKIDLVKTNLDGSNRKTVVQGNGNEDDRSTLLLASTDWKYLAYIVRHDGEKAKLYIVDTASDEVTKEDGGQGVTITATGWSGHKFIYTVQRDEKIWESGFEKLKSLDATSKQLQVLEETVASGSSINDYQGERINNIYLLSGGVFYTKFTESSNYANAKISIHTINPDASSRITIKEFENKGYGSITAMLYEPEKLYLTIYRDEKNEHYTFKDNSLEVSKKLIADDFTAEPRPTYVTSPDKSHTFWHEMRDGKNSLLIGDKFGQNSTELRSSTDMLPYGWFTDRYLLVSREGSELYIISSSMNSPTTIQDLIKISDYHKPALVLRGLGYGYGGL